MPKELTLLPSVKARTWTEDSLPSDWVAVERYQSVGSHAPFEVVVASAPKKPLAAELRSVWRQRYGGRATDLVLVVRYPVGASEDAAVVGPTDESRQLDVPLSAVITCCTEALAAPTPTAARNAVAPLFADASDTPIGLRNDGLFANYALLHYPARHPDAWELATARASGIRSTQGTDLLRYLGWQVDAHGDTHLLREDGHSRAVAVLLQGDEAFDRPAQRFGPTISPVEHALAVAAKEEVAWVQAIQGQRIRLYPARADLSIRRTGLTSYVEIDIALLPEDKLAYAPLLLSPEALRTGGTAFDVLADSRTRASALGARLRDRVYRDVIPPLATIVARHAAPTDTVLSESGLNEAYHCTLVILFRTLFVAYAEDRELLPYTGDAAVGYNRVALNNRAREWTDHKPSFDPNATDLWDALTNIWHAVFHGSTDWGVPQYGGGLFDDDTIAGKEIARLRLTNAEIGPALEALLIDADRGDDRGPVDFATLSVREFGTIYEGLLESSLSVAPTDLMLNKDEVYVPAKPGGEVEVRSGEVYFHNSSGARKATGSYFTKEFAVEHLLTTALDPTLDEHLERVLVLLDANRTADAAAHFFDFRVADIAMGSGHFLVGAVDHIATKMSLFLTKHPIEEVVAELDQLRDAAVFALEDVGRSVDSVTLTPESLVRRQVARRCVYGVDINEIAVDLARLALWIHTFVPGLPMSSLDHGLVWGNSLTGIGSVEEALAALADSKSMKVGTQGSLFEGPIEDALAAASADHERAAVLFEATPSESAKAARLHAEAFDKMEPTRLAFDAAVAGRQGLIDLSAITLSGWDAVVAAGRSAIVRETITELHPVHFPVSFPEVFNRARENPGFNVILGNPPWDEVMVEEPKFWQRYRPGVMGLKPDAQPKEIRRLRKEHPELLPVLERERSAMAFMREALLVGPYPQLGEGDVDYYKAFSWRYWALLRKSGRMGVVFPRSLLNAAGSSSWRESLLSTGHFDLIATLVNTGKWVFDDVHGQYSVALITLSKRLGKRDSVYLSGPFHSKADFDSGAQAPGELDKAGLLSWGNGGAFPLLPDVSSASIFNKFRNHPRFDALGEWGFRPVREFDATNDRKTFDSGELVDGRWPVLTGASFNLWDPDFGDPYAWADPETVSEALFTKRKRQSRNKRTAFFGLSDAIINDRSTLPCLAPRIVFRDIARATDTRTMIACLAPGEVVATNKAPYLYRTTGFVCAEAFILGIISSIPFDWYTRRFVELSMAIGIVNALPVPHPPTHSSLCARVIEISGRLAAVDDRFADWAAEVGVPVGSVTSDAMKEDLISELDAVVSHLYGLDRDDVVHIFETFHRGWDYLPRLTAVLEHFDRWSGAE